MRRGSLGLLFLLSGGCDLFGPSEAPPVQATLEPAPDEGVTIPLVTPTAPIQFASFLLSNEGGSVLYASPATVFGETIKNTAGINDGVPPSLIVADLPAFTQLSPGQKRLLQVSVDPRSWRWRTGEYTVTFPLELRYFWGGQDADEPDPISTKEEPEIVPLVVDLIVNFSIDCDLDDDGFDDVACGGEDCDDADDVVRPGALEHCDGIDEDCDGAKDEAAVDRQWFYPDLDDDRYGDPDAGELHCEDAAPADWIRNDEDCDDAAHRVNPGELESCSDLIDNDCDGFIDGRDRFCGGTGGP